MARALGSSQLGDGTPELSLNNGYGYQRSKKSQEKVCTRLSPLTGSTKPATKDGPKIAASQTVLKTSYSSPFSMA